MNLNKLAYLDLIIDRDCNAKLSQLSVNFSISFLICSHCSHFGEPRSSLTLLRYVLNISFILLYLNASFRIHSTPPRTPDANEMFELVELP